MTLKGETFWLDVDRSGIEYRKLFTESSQPRVTKSSYSTLLVKIRCYSGVKHLKIKKYL